MYTKKDMNKNVHCIIQSSSGNGNQKSVLVTYIKEKSWTLRHIQKLSQNWLNTLKLKL